MSTGPQTTKTNPTAPADSKQSNPLSPYLPDLGIKPYPGNYTPPNQGIKGGGGSAAGNAPSAPSAPADSKQSNPLSPYLPDLGIKPYPGNYTPPNQGIKGGGGRTASQIIGDYSLVGNFAFNPRSGFPSQLPSQQEQMIKIEWSKQPFISELQQKAYIATNPESINQIRIISPITQRIGFERGIDIIGPTYEGLGKISEYNIAHPKQPVGLQKFSYKLIPEMKSYEEQIKGKSSWAPPFNILPNPPKFSYNIIKGGLMDVRENPLKYIVITGISAGVGFGLGFVSKGISAGAGAIGLTPQFTADFGSILGTAGISYTGYSTYKGISAQSTTELKWEYIGKTGAELTAAGIGFSTGKGLFNQAQDYIMTRGRTELSSKGLIPEDVLSGKNRFPLGPKSSEGQLELFKTQSIRLPGQTMPTTYHATGDIFWENTLTASTGSSEFQGLYGSYGVSPNFLRIDNFAKMVWSSVNIFGGYGRPGVSAIEPTKFSTENPISLPKGNVQGIVGKEYGVGYIPGYKTEVEAIFIPGSEAKLTGKNFFFQYKGRAIPIDTFKMTGLGTPIEGAGKSFFSGFPSSSGLSSTSSSIYFNPSSLYKGASSSKISNSYLISSPVYSNASKISSQVYSKISKSISYTTSKSSIQSSIVSSPIFIPSSPIVSRSSPKTSISLPYLSPYPGLMTFNIFGGEYFPRKMKFKFGKQPLKYTPSLTAKAFNIKSSSMPKFSMSGIMRRPIIGRSRK